MKTPNITPGPWGKEVNVINYRSGMKALEVRGSKNELVATFPGCDRDKANATAIAAVPDLIEALIDVRRALELANFTGELAVVDTALRKAGCTDA